MMRQSGDAARRSNAERTRETRAALVKAARRQFARHGFAATATPDIVAAAGLTRGALYHHFADKSALFKAVIAEESAALARKINVGIAGIDDPIAALVEGTRAFLEAISVPGRTRLLLLDGPAVLGREAMDRIESETSVAVLRGALSNAIAARRIVNLPIDALVGQLSAMFDRAALAIEGGERHEDHLRVITAIFQGLRV